MTRPTTRREFLFAATSGLSLGTGSLLAASSQAAIAATLDAARRQAAHRRRRVIFNNDGDDIWAAGADTVDKFLARRHTPLLGTHVDSIFYCTTQSFNHFTHDTKVAEVFESTEGKSASNNLGEFLKQKTDGLRMSSQFAREHGLETIWTLRMNDIHDSWTPAFLPKWKRDDPTRVMSSLEKTTQFNDRRRLWSLVDFEHADVKPRMLEIIDEVLTNYDIDGIELDFLRAPIYFRTAYSGQAVTGKQVAVLTRLVRSIRELVLKQSQRRGKPFLLVVRVPSTQALCRKIGIDIGAWLQEKLIDVMVLGGGYITFDVPVKKLIELGHQHDVPVYPCLSQSGLMYRPPRGKSTKQPPEAWFGAATRLWHDRADGVYTFNLFPGPAESDRKFAREILSTIGSPKMLAAKTNMYAIRDTGGWMPSHYWSKDAEEFSKASLGFAKALPMPLKPNVEHRTSLYVPEELRGAGFDVTAELRLDFTGLSPDSTPLILFNEANFGPQKDGKQVDGVQRYTCRVPVPAIRQGPNSLFVMTKADGAKLAGAELWIRR